MEIFKLVGSIMVDTASAENSLQKTGDQAEGVGSKLASGVKTAAKWATAITGAAVAVGGAMVKAAQDTASELDTIDKASTRMGITAESYQELAHAASLCGVEMSTMERAAKKLEGTDLNMDSALDQLMAIADEGERTQAAIDMFGESVAYQLTPLLAQGADGLAAMKQEANDLGIVMSGDAVKAGADLNDQFTKITESVGALKNSLMAELMPYVSKILDWVITNMPIIQSSIKSLIDAVIPIVTPLLDLIMAFLPEFLSVFQSVMSAIQPPIEWVIGLISDALSGLTTMIQVAGGWVSRLFGGGSSKNSHASGIVSVPYDNYSANLHRGETVLNASDSNTLVEMLRNGVAANADSSPIMITVQSVLDGKVIGESVTKYQRNKVRAYG